MLLDALVKYTGTVVFVSHDRYFIDKLATRVFEVGDGKVEIFPGNYEDYLWRKQGGQHVAPTLDDVPSHVSQKQRDAGHPRITDSANSGKPSADATNGNNGNASSASASAEAPKKRLNPIKRKQLEDRVRALEAEIGRTESAIEHLESGLQNFVSADENQRQSQELDERKTAHAALIREWENLAETLQGSD
jgi:ATP-binding cassette subfamily F protein 3